MLYTMALNSSPVYMAPSSPALSCDARYISTSIDDAATGGGGGEHAQKRGGTYGKKRERRDSTQGSHHVRSHSTDGGSQGSESSILQNVMVPPPPPASRESSGYSHSPKQTKSRRTSFADVKTTIQKAKSSPSFIMQLEEAVAEAEMQERARQLQGTLAISTGEEQNATLDGDHAMNDPAPARVESRMEGTCLTVGTSHQRHGGSRPPMNRVQSMPLLAMAPTASSNDASSTGEEQHQQVPSYSVDPFADTNPEGYMQTIIESHGYPSTPIETLSVSGSFFLEHTPEQIEAYDNEVTGAVRTGDIPALRRMLRDGKPLQCSNRFGESIVHMACRQGSHDIVKFLLEEAGVSIRVRDDVGRTPLHDACWSSAPSFELITMLIERDPDLLLLCDKRGHTPLAYVRRNHWGEWCRFLNTVREYMIPREVVKPKVSF